MMTPPNQSQSHTTKNPDFDRDIANFSEDHNARQVEALKLLDSGLIKFLLYGGALGGGKSYFLRWYGIRRLFILFKVFGLRDVTGMLACEDYPALKDRQLQKISREVPLWLGRMHQDHKDYGRCLILNKRWGGGILCFRNLDDPSKYASSEWAFILVDELTKNQLDVFTFLRTRLRWPGLPDVECQYVGGTNPGSIGHGWVKQLWIDKMFGPEWIKPIDYRNQFAFVRSLADDNPNLTPEYWAMLETLPINLRKAFRYGDWNVFVGQAFPEFSRDIHVLNNSPDIPRNAPIYMTYDWGFGKPFSIGWWWVDADNKAYRFSEWYGWNGTADEGLRIADSAVAEGIGFREEQIAKKFVLPVTEYQVEPLPGQYYKMHRIEGIYRYAGHDCFAKKPDTKGGGQGPPTSEVFSRYGLYLIKGDSTRELKIRQFRERIRVQDNGSTMLYVYPECEQFIRTIPNLVMDEHKLEDVDTNGEDHTYDEACHICMARPLSLEMPGVKKPDDELRIERLIKGEPRPVEEFLERESAIAQRQLENTWGEDIPLDNGRLKRTI